VVHQHACAHAAVARSNTAALGVGAAGVEVGQYAGFVAALRALQQDQPGALPPRSDRNLAAMEECLRQFPLYDPTVRGDTRGGGRQRGRHSTAGRVWQRSTKLLCLTSVAPTHVPPCPHALFHGACSSSQPDPAHRVLLLSPPPRMRP
jgi:hypothetical protein